MSDPKNIEELLYDKFDLPQKVDAGQLRYKLSTWLKQ
jgi:hypothetical protein